VGQINYWLNGSAIYKFGSRGQIKNRQGQKPWWFCLEGHVWNLPLAIGS